MSLPDEIRKFVLNRYILPARDRDEDIVTFSAQVVQQGMGSEVTAAQVCGALDTRTFLDLGLVTLIQREGPSRGPNAQWTFGVSMQGQRGEVLVAVLKNKGDLTILKEEGWYRIPIQTAPRRWPPKWIAFYQGVKWGETCGINYYASVREIQEASRRELFPDETSTRKSNKRYYQIFLGPLQQVDPPLVSRRPRVIVFIPTTWRKFIAAQGINDLYDESPLEDLLWYELKKQEIFAERQWRVRVDRKHYYLDFALFCQDANVAVETDGDSWHGDRPQILADKKRQNDLTSTGWHILRFGSWQIREQMTSYCLPKIKKTITRYGGIVSPGRSPRKFYSFPPDDLQQLSLFEAKAGYDLD